MREERIDQNRPAQSDELVYDRWHQGRAPASPSRRHALDRRDWTAEDEVQVFRLMPEETSQEQEKAPEPNTIMGRLMQRKLAQWFIAYLAVAWILLQLTEILAPMWNLPLPIQRSISVSLGLGTFPALVVAWYHGEMGRQRVCWAEACIIAAMVVGTATMVWRVCIL